MVLRSQRWLFEESRIVSPTLRPQTDPMACWTFEQGQAVLMMKPSQAEVVLPPVRGLRCSPHGSAHGLAKAAQVQLTNWCASEGKPPPDGNIIHNTNDLTEAVPLGKRRLPANNIAAHCVEGTMVISQLRIILGRVEHSMSYLMNFQGDHLIGAAYKAYPDPSDEIRKRSQRGDSPLRVASEMLRIMFVTEIENVQADRRELLAAYLVSTAEAPPFAFAKICRMYCAQIYIAKHAKQLDEQWCLDCMQDVFFAAKGLSVEERSNDRARRPLQKAPQAPSGDGEQRRTARPTDRDDEFAAFVAQFAARGDRCRAYSLEAEGTEPTVQQTESTNCSFSSLLGLGRSLLASSSAGHLGAGGLLLGLLIVAFFLGGPFQPSRPPLSSRVQQEKAGGPSTDKSEAKALLPVSVPPVSAAAVSSSLVSLPHEERDKSAPIDPPATSQTPPIVHSEAAPLTPDEIRDLQGKLKAAGFNPGPIDGTLGSQTRGAVRKYAETRAFPSADVTRELLARLQAEALAPVPSQPGSSPPVPQQVDKSGSPREPPASQILSTAQISSTPLTRDEIRDLQSKLKATGYNPGAIDGAMGRQTRSAVREYAEDRALPTADATRGLLEP
jgi:peptidoglycan hydrolase-like protein with peptidoglycan-binding domain